jgi:hypothetical protein
MTGGAGPIDLAYFDRRHQLRPVSPVVPSSAALTSTREEAIYWRHFFELDLFFRISPGCVQPGSRPTRPASSVR